jgi:hypothetical protein
MQIVFTATEGHPLSFPDVFRFYFLDIVSVHKFFYSCFLKSLLLARNLVTCLASMTKNLVHISFPLNNKRKEVLEQLPCIQKLPGSNFEQDTVLLEVYHDLIRSLLTGGRVVPSVKPRNFAFQFIVRSNPTIQRHVV